METLTLELLASCSATNVEQKRKQTANSLVLTFSALVCYTAGVLESSPDKAVKLFTLQCASYSNTFQTITGSCLCLISSKLDSTVLVERRSRSVALIDLVNGEQEIAVAISNARPS